MALIVVLVVLVLVVLFFVSTFNGLVTARNAFKNAFAQIDVQLTRRYDLIPNLVETAKAYMKHERETLEAVTQARNGALSGLKAAAANPADAAAVQQLAGAEAQLGGALGRLFAVAEAYPDLKANQNMMQIVRGADLDGEQSRLRPPGLQRCRHELQQPREVFPATSSPACSASPPAQPLEVAEPEVRQAPKVISVSRSRRAALRHGLLRPASSFATSIAALRCRLRGHRGRGGAGARCRDFTVLAAREPAGPGYGPQPLGPLSYALAYPDTALGVSVLIVAAIALSSAFKSQQLRAGGAVVARSLGARAGRTRHPGSEPPAAAQHRRGNVDRLRCSHARDLRARTGTRDQRLRCRS